MIRWMLDTINMDATVDSAGAQWLVTETQGWFDSPALRQSVVDKDIGHGSIVAVTVMDKRTVRIAGICKVTGTEDNVWRSRDRLMAALATFTGPKVLTVTEYGIQKQVNYWAGGAAGISIMPGGFEFDITLTVEDPRKFSPLTSLAANIANGANANVQPYGSFQTPPTFTVSNIAASANTNPITITDTVGGSLIGTIQMLPYLTPAGETKLVIDSMNRTVQGMNAAGGNVVSRYGSINVASLNWFDLATANNNIAFLGANYVLTPSWRDAWL